jgi:PHD/YefM family antitoxin component YafN of YafNO toxin-antitoxin module
VRIINRAAGKILKRVVIGKEHLIVERDGYPVAVMVSYPEYEQMMRERSLATHRELVQTLGDEAERRGITEEQLMTELEEIRKAVYQETYGKTAN